MEEIGRGPGEMARARAFGRSAECSQSTVNLHDRKKEHIPSFTLSIIILRHVIRAIPQCPPPLLQHAHHAVSWENRHSPVNLADLTVNFRHQPGSRCTCLEDKASGQMPEHPLLLLLLLLRRLWCSRCEALARTWNTAEFALRRQTDVRAADAPAGLTSNCCPCPCPCFPEEWPQSPRSGIPLVPGPD